MARPQVPAEPGKKKQPTTIEGRRRARTAAAAVREKAVEAAAKQALTAFEMRLRGASYPEIGKHIGVSENVAWEMVKSLLDRTLAMCEEEASRQWQLSMAQLGRDRKVLNDRLEKLGALTAEGAEDNAHIAKAIHDITKEIRQHDESARRLLGTDKPSKAVVAVTTLEDWLAQSGLGAPEQPALPPPSDADA